MLDTLRAWLNGTRDYNTGVLLYNIVGTDDQLKKLFAEGFTMWNKYRLQEELTTICTALKNTASLAPSSINKLTADLKGIKAERNSVPAGSEKFAKLSDKANEIQEILTSVLNTADAIAKTISPPNPELYNASLEDAKKIYKGAMNKRAVVWAMIPTDKYSDYNRQDIVEARKQLCLDVVREYNHASELYDQADFVKLNGKLPNQEDTGIEEEIASLPDFEVKQSLDNARKAYNKLKGREATADRVALMQKHKIKIEKLEKRWRSLKPKKQKPRKKRK